MKVAIIILNWNGKKDTLECLASLQKLNREQFSIEVIVVDNNSLDDSVDFFKKKFPQITILEQKENLGFVDGNNIGIEYALENNADYMLLLNNDTTVDKNLLIELISSSKRYKNKALLGAKIYFSKGNEFHKDRYKKNELGRIFWYAGGIIDWNNVLPTHRGVDEVDYGQYDHEDETDFISGCVLFAHRSVFEKVGLLNEKYFAYYEDVDFSVLAKRKRFKLVYTPKAVVWHKNAGSSGGSGSSMQQYYMIRNQLVFGMKYASVQAKFALLRQSLIILAKGNTWERWGIMDYFMGRLGKTEREFSNNIQKNI